MKRVYLYLGLKLLLLFNLCIANQIVFGQSFSSSDLKNITIGNPTSLQFGPDGKLYVIQQDATIKVFTIVKDGPNNYRATNTEVINLVKNIPNHNDDGTDFIPANNGQIKRQSTGIYVGGTASAPIIYASSSDFRIGAGEMGDVNLCTNSGIISKLYKEGGSWKKIDLVRGLPRSEENHAPNGIQIHGNKLLISIGGQTNSGAPSRLWTYITEYALSAAILVVELDVIEAMPTKMDPTGLNPYKYDLPTLDDPTRENKADGTDVNDPWGGNDGLNQAKIVPGAPVQVFSAGFRNSYDVLISKFPGREGWVYTIDNGPNRNWGGYPAHEGYGTATNQYPENEPGSLTVGNYDQLELIGDIDTYVYGSYYGGHPCPIRGNPLGAGLYTDNGTIRGWRNDNSNPDLPLPIDWPPVPVADSIEGKFLDPGTIQDKSLLNFLTSTNGLCEYLYSQNGLYGDMITASMDGNIYRIRTDNTHHVINAKNSWKVNQDAPLATGFGNKPLDIVAQADGEIFEGTIWIATWGSSKISIFEPQNITCTGTNSPTLDDDGDGYKNSDEIDNATDPCSGSSKPNDFDGDLVSDKNDLDDDNDGIPDKQDYFAIDNENGMHTHLPTHYHLFNYDPGTGFYGLGFTGLMNNGAVDYLTLYSDSNLIAGGAAGALTIEAVPYGDAFEDLNNQQYGFQFGIKILPSDGMFTVKSGILPLFFNAETPVNEQSQGIFIGTGDQDNYIKLVLHANGGQGGIQLLTENDGIANSVMATLPNGIPNQTVIFYFTVDPDAKLVYAKYMIGGTAYSIGTPVPLTGKILDAITNPDKAMAVGIISTARLSNKPFNASWDFIEAYSGSVLAVNNKTDVYDNINIYPNPGRDKITININSGVAQEYSVTVFNSYGQEVKSFDLYHHPGGGDYETDIQELTTGIYYLRFTSDKEKKLSTVKLIKK